MEKGFDEEEIIKCVQMLNFSRNSTPILASPDARILLQNKHKVVHDNCHKNSCLMMKFIALLPRQRQYTSDQSAIIPPSYLLLLSRQIQ